MRLEVPHRHERFGAVRVHEPIQVVELDSGLDDDGPQPEGVVHVPTTALHEVERELAIVVPTMNERRKVIDGVLSGIPHDCPIVIVSASDREPIDRFELEFDVASWFCAASRRSAVLVHQDDPALAAAVTAAGLGEMVEQRTVRRGKGEAMVVGTLIAAAREAAHVGFVDADNYVPGAVHEYVKAFAAGLHLSPTPYAMVRICWQSKPKLEQGRLVFNRWGRTSEVTNRFLNLVLSTYIGFGTDIIATGNAGEHAMTMELARRLRFAGGFAVEPFELVELFEQFGGATPPRHPEVLRSMVDVYQVETRNPHLHEDKGMDHVNGMRLQALNVLYHSPVCPETVRHEIRRFLAAEGRPAGDPPAEPIYPHLAEADIDAFMAALARAPTFREVGPSRLP